MSTGLDGRIGRLEAAHPFTATATMLTLAEWQETRTLSDADALRRWPEAWPAVADRRAAAREAEELAGVIDGT